MASLESYRESVHSKSSCPATGRLVHVDNTRTPLVLVCQTRVMRYLNDMRFLLFLFMLLFSGTPLLHAKECVVLLHGLARTSSSMEKMEKRLAGDGYTVANIDYPSRRFNIEKLAGMAVEAGLRRCEEQQASPVHFVAHSLGGILIRQYFSTHKRPEMGRVVMLGPPNKGSEVVDTLKDFPGFSLLNGPAGRELGTDANSVPLSLPPVDFELGVIAGTTSINLFLSMMLPNPDDGKVSLQSTKVEGMRDFIALDVTHPFMMKSDRVINATLSFLRDGQFQKTLPANQPFINMRPSN